MKNTTLSHTRFLTRGELLDFFIKTLEIENINDADRRRYQRFISEEHISIEEYNETLEIYIDRILEELIIDKSKIDSAKNTIEEFFKLYLNIIQNVDVYAFQQECINIILTEHLYIPFLIFFNEYYLATKIDIFDSDTNPLNTIFNMFKTEICMEDKDFRQYLFTELANITNGSKNDKTLTQSIQNWLHNKAFPNMYNIEYMAEIFSNVSLQSKDELKQYFIVAKLIEKSNISKEIIFKKNLNIVSGNELEKYISKCVPQYQNIIYLTEELYNLTNIQKEKTKEMEKQFELVCIQVEEKGFNSDNMPYIAWCKARYHAQKKEFKEATKYYKSALINGKNSIGKHYIDIVKEGLIVSAWTTKKNVLDLKNTNSSFTKFYIEAYFLKLIDSPPSEIKQYFLNDMKKKFSTYFIKLYPDTNIKEATFKAHEHGIIDTSELEKIKTNLKNPNKRITTKYPNSVNQLMHYASKVDYSKVKKLIDSGADADITRFNDNGTALIMVLSNEFTQKKREDTIKIAKLLISKMSKDALDAKLPRKKMTALGFAIDLGYVEIVKNLIEKGVDINQIITFEKVSPLYYILKKISEAKMDLATTFNAMHQSNDQDILKVVNSMPSNIPYLNNAITDQEKIEAFKQHQKTINSSPRYKDFMQISTQHIFEQSKVHLAEYYKIFDLLLNSDPDLEIRFKGNMHTVLILATQLNEVELVKKLLDAGADKYATIYDKHTAKAFARENGNKELIELL